MNRLDVADHLADFSKMVDIESGTHHAVAVSVLMHPTNENRELTPRRYPLFPPLLQLIERCLVGLL